MRFIVLLLLILSSCTPNNVDEEDLSSYFSEVGATGTFALLNNNNGRFTIYNVDRYRDSAYAPASTFKIVNSLVGLQTGVISSDTMRIAWDGVRRNPEWDKDLSMIEAFRASAVPYYQEVARRIGKDTLQQWLDSLSYGTRKITGPVDSFWLDGSLKITPDEQLGLVKQLYFRELPFHNLNQDIVKKAMLMEDKPEYRLGYKTGWAPPSAKDGRHTGWVVGWIEENNHPYLFVLNLSSAHPDFNMREARMKILKGILDKMGFMKGEK
jgi:beta-lactamase class D